MHPTGTVTFLFTDVEGSTQLWERSPDAMRAALMRHDALIAQLVAQHEGVLVRPRGEGDSRFAVFTQASHAAAAASAIQLALDHEPWDLPERLRARLALHTGEADVREGDYYGTDVNRCARLRAIAHGGQVLLSSTTAALVRGHLPADITLRSLGTYQLRDLAEPEHVFQLLHPELLSDFPPLLAAGARLTNLPVALTPLIGRERELAEVRRHLDMTRVLTLTGAGGVGKTRLGLQVALAALEAYRDGVWLVELAALSDPSLVTHAVAAAVGARDQPSKPLRLVLQEYLRDRVLLLVLDNCEHLLAGCADFVAAALSACPDLRVLATSREPLGVAGEVIWRVPSLAMPDPESPFSAVRLLEFPAVQLFAERAAASAPGFAVTEHRAAAVAQVCVRLDGIPLALELAAARVRVLSVEQIAARLDDRFRLLVCGSRTAPSRHQTLQAAIAWSYDLLSMQEQLLYDRLSVFAGGWALEAAEAVCSDQPLRMDRVLDLLARLVDRSLVTAEPEPGSEEPRYRLLETLREYGHLRLTEHAEVDAIQRHHADYYATLAERSGPELLGPGQDAWLHRLDREHDNLRAALRWSVERRDSGTCLRLVGSLWRFWEMHGHLDEGRRWLTAALALAEGTTAPGPRAVALHGAGFLAYRQGDFRAARAMFEQVLAIRPQLGDTPTVAASLTALGTVAQDESAYAEARVLHAESLAMNRRLGSRNGLVSPVFNLGFLALSEGDTEHAAALFEESLSLGRELRDNHVVAASLDGLGWVTHRRGNPELAASLLEESLGLLRGLGHSHRIARVLCHLGLVAIDRDDPQRAMLFLCESLSLARELGDTRSIADVLDGLGRLAVAGGQLTRAAGLLAAVEVMRDKIGFSPAPVERVDHERCVAATRAGLAPDAFAAAWADGQGMTVDQAVAGVFAVGEVPTTVDAPTGPRQQTQTARYPAASLIPPSTTERFG